VCKGTTHHDSDDEGARAVKDDKCSKTAGRSSPEDWGGDFLREQCSVIELSQSRSKHTMVCADSAARSS
jgi:hypothetical protein